jgi:branched-chain amino acid transport system permease protein
VSAGPFAAPTGTRATRLGAESRAIVRAAAPALVLTLALFVSGFFLSSEYELGLLIQIGLFAITVIGLNFTLDHLGLLNVGQAAMFGIGAYAGSKLTLSQGGEWFLPAVLFGGLAAAACAIVFGALVLRLQGLYFAMASLGLAMLAAILFGELEGLTGGHEGLVGVPLPMIGSIELAEPREILGLVCVFVAIVALFSAAFRRTRWYRMAKAIRTSQLLATASGVGVTRTRLVNFTVGSFFTGCAGVIFASFIGYAAPGYYTLEFSLNAIAMAVLGGVGSIAGALAGAALFVEINSAARSYPGWSPVINGTVLLSVLIFAPRGLAGLGATAKGLWRRYSSRRADRGAAQGEGEPLPRSEQEASSR